MSQWKHLWFRPNLILPRTGYIYTTPFIQPTHTPDINMFDKLFVFSNTVSLEQSFNAQEGTQWINLHGYVWPVS